MKRPRPPALTVTAVANPSSLLIVALTGGIATGKSVVAESLRRRGCYVQSADAVARELMAPGTPAWKAIVGHFGPSILNSDRLIDRRRFGELLFADRRARDAVNRIVHPLVLEEKKATIARLEKEGRYEIFVSEAALTLESGFAPFFDRVVVVWCPATLQVRRLMARDGINRPEALRKIRSQMDIEKKKAYADYLIDTSGTLEDTERQAEVLYGRLRTDYQQKKARMGPGPAPSAA